MISLNSQAFLSLIHNNTTENKAITNSADFSIHQQWNHEGGWKNTLNNIRLIIQPTLLLWIIYPWLDIFPSANLLLGFNHLIAAINQCQPFYSYG